MIACPRFRCVSKTEHVHGVWTLKFTEIFDAGVPEQLRFHDTAPCGEVTVEVSSKQMADRFLLGDQYHFQITPALWRSSQDKPRRA